MNAARLQVIIEGPEIAERGMSLDDLNKTLNHFQLPGYLMSSCLTGAVTIPGQFPARIRWNDGPPPPETAPGSLALEFEVTPAAGRPSAGGDAMQAAVDWLMGGPPPGTEPLPRDAVELSRLWTDLSPEITLIALYNPATGHRVNIGPHWQPEPGPAVSESVPAVVHGKLMAVDWENRTARLQRYFDTPIPLRFGAALDREMQRVTRQRVEVKGQGRFDANDHWAEVQVEHIKGTRPYPEPDDLDAFRNNPNFKPFDPNNIITTDEPFDVDEFLRSIDESGG